MMRRRTAASGATLASEAFEGTQPRAPRQPAAPPASQRRHLRRSARDIQFDGGQAARRATARHWDPSEPRVLMMAWLAWRREGKTTIHPIYDPALL